MLKYVGWTPVLSLEPLDFSNKQYFLFYRGFNYHEYHLDFWGAFACFSFSFIPFFQFLCTCYDVEDSRTSNVLNYLDHSQGWVLDKIELPQAPLPRCTEFNTVSSNHLGKSV